VDESLAPPLVVVVIETLVTFEVVVNPETFTV
jgi:hypothetical protein